MNPFKAPVLLDGTLVENIVFDKYYDLPDAKGYMVVFRKSGKTVVVEIKEGKKKRVQYGSIPRLSFKAGQDDAGEPRLLPYQIELHPAKPIFPVRPLVTRLRTMGLEFWQITPVFHAQLADCVANHSGPEMLSDGVVTKTDVPAHGDLMGSTEFVVENATWAVRLSGNTINHVYVWMTAADPDNESALLAALRQIQAGELMSV